MTVRRSNGMLAYASIDNWSAPCWKVQLYWPEIKLGGRECHVMFRTTLRVVWSERVRGFGFQVFGFGLGVVIEMPPMPPSPLSASPRTERHDEHDQARRCDAD